MVHLVCLFMKTDLLALLQDDLVRYRPGRYISLSLLGNKHQESSNQTQIFFITFYTGLQTFGIFFVETCTRLHTNTDLVCIGYQL